MKSRLYIRPVSASDVDRVAMFCAASPGPGAVVRNLAQLAAGGCLLQARLDGQVAGIVGLDLDGRAIAGPWLGSKAGGVDLGRRLLTAAEQLAARYGMTHLIVYPAANSTSFFADNGYFKVSGGLGDSAGRVGMSRSIIRRSTRLARRVRSLLDELGIPRDYGARHRLMLQAEARSVATIGEDIYGREQKMAPRAAAAWRRMVDAAANDGCELQAVSAFRTIDYQAGLIRRKLQQGQAIESILEVSAAPGYSEHHSGRAVDVTAPGCEVLEEPFENTAAFEWLMANARRFGFRLSYPRGNPHGVAYEPWHWCWGRN